MLTIALTILSTEEIQILITVLTILSLEETAAQHQATQATIQQEPQERAVTTQQILLILQEQEVIATLLVDLTLQVLQVEVCVPQEVVVEAERDRQAEAEEAEEVNTFL